MASEDTPYQFLKRRLAARLGPVGQADGLEAYLHSLSELYAEYEYGIRMNPALQRYLGTHPADGEIISLVSSSSKLDPHPDAIDLARRKAQEKDDELFGKVNAQAKRVQQLRDVVTELKRTRMGMQDVSDRDPHRVSCEELVGYLTRMLKAMPIAKAKHLLTMTEREEGKLHPFLHRHLEQIIQGTLQEHEYPSNSREGAELKRSVVNAMYVASDLLLYGDQFLGNGALEAYEEARILLQLMKEQTLDAVQLNAESNRICETTLKPAICKMMVHLHGMDANVIKRDNICIHGESSSDIMDAVLSSAAGHSGHRGAFSRQPTKKLLVFSMSWDGLKTLHKDANMETSVIPGSVSARALEHYIQETILKRKFVNDPEAAKAEVRRQVGALVMNIPENPIGKIPADAEMSDLARVISKYDIPLVVVDEVFSAPGHRSLISYPDMGNRCYVLSGTSKNISVNTKLSYGYTENDQLAGFVNRTVAKQHELHPVTAAGLGGLITGTPESYYEQNQTIYKQKREIVSAAMAQTNYHFGMENGIGWLHEPNYGCLGVVQFAPELMNSAGIKNSVQLAEYLYKLSGVRTIPVGDMECHAGMPFGVRINISGDEVELSHAIERMGIAMDFMRKGKSYVSIKGSKYRGDEERSGGGGDLLSAIMSMVGEEMQRRSQRRN